MQSRTHSSSPTKHTISTQALLEQTQNWQLTLNRQQKKLKHLHTKLHSKILINQIQILIISIDSELLSYKKTKALCQPNGKADPKYARFFKDGHDVILMYNQMSKKFMAIMEAIGEFVDKVEAMLGEGVDVAKDEPFEQVDANNTKTYKQQTFTYTISKQQKHKNQISKPTSSSKPSHKLQKSNIKHNKNSKLIQYNSTNIPKSNKSTIHSHSSYTHPQQMQMDSWQMRYQLKQIKSMMSQIKNEILYHSHQDIETQLSKLQHNNKKLSLQVKGLRQDSQYIVSRIQKLKQQLTTQKQIQSEMIKQFENPYSYSHPQQNQIGKRKQYLDESRGKTKSYSIEGSRIRNNGSSGKKACEDVSDGISDWVRVRI